MPIKRNINKLSITLSTVIVLAFSILQTELLPAETAIDDPVPTKIKAHESNLELTTIANGFTAPVAGAIAPIKELSNLMFIADQIGLIWSVDLNSGDKTQFIDLQSRTVKLGAFSPGGYDERGLLGLAFHPNYKENGLLYVFTSEAVSGNADFSTLDNSKKANHQSVVLELTIENPSDINGNTAIKNQRELLRIDQPQYNHNGGSLVFDSNNLLYIGIGDGGKSDDQGPGHSENGNGDDLSNPLGSILRIDPLGNNSTNKHYGIPSNNPFTDNPNALDEIFAYGLRNPWKMSFDSYGNLYVADVGQNHIEEINVVVKGGHYGWPIREGTFWFDNNKSGRGFVSRQAPQKLSKQAYNDPLLQYDHDEGVSVTGGYVYEGASIKALKNNYIFADFRGRIFIGDTKNKKITVSNITPEILLFSFALDQAGEIYVMGNKDANTKGQTGKLYKLVETKTEQKNDD